MRQITKKAIGKALGSRWGTMALGRWRKQRGVALGYHNVIPDAERVTGEPSIHIKQSEFEWQVDLVERHCDVVPLSNLVASIRHTERPQRLRASFTFDDAYRGAIRFAIPFLLSKGYPSTVFVATEMMGGRSFWWDDLPISGWEGGREPLYDLQGYDQAVRRWAENSGLTAREQGLNQVSSTWDELEDLVRASRGMVTVGLHTVRHPNLATLTSRQIREELRVCRNTITTRGLPLANVLAFPYGLVNSQVALVARSLGIEAGFKIGGGVLPEDPSGKQDLPRAVIPSGLSRDNFLLRIFGVIPG